MNRFSAYPFLRITPAFILGIVCFHYLSSQLKLTFSVMIPLVVFFIVLVFIDARRFRVSIGLIGLILVFLFGYLRLQMFKDDFDPKHLMYSNEVLDAYQATIIAQPQEKKNSRRFVVEVEKGIKGKEELGLSGKVNLYLDKETSSSLKYGDVLLIKGQPEKTSGPANPGEFDYRNYLIYNNIFHQHFASDKFTRLGSRPGSKIKEISLRLSEACRTIIGDRIENESIRGVVLALVIGIKDELDSDLQRAYSSAGAMHVLAVSGLHVGIVYGLILLIFKRLRLVGKNRRWLLAIVSLFALWTYAFVTGLSPSVLRAVTMFSFIAIGKASKRNTNIYNTLAASAFVLLWYNPYLIMSVGFQLSYLAVFGIVYLQPKFYGLITIKNPLLDKVWAITCVSLAAQIATGPLSVLYFHQFPSYFFLSNLFIIPAALVILILGLALLTLGWVPLLGTGISWVLKWIVNITNELVFMVEGLPGSLLEGIYVKTYEAWLIYLGIVALILLFSRKKFKYMLWAFSLLLGFCMSQVWDRNNYAKRASVSFFRVTNASVQDFSFGGVSKIFGDTSFINDRDKLRFSIAPKRLTSYQNLDFDSDGLVLQSTVVPGGTIVVFGGKRFLRLANDSLMHTEMTDKIKFDYVVIGHNAKISLEKLIDRIDFGSLIIDSSTRKYLRDQLSSQAEALNLEVHSVTDDGFLEIKLAQ